LLTLMIMIPIGVLPLFRIIIVLIIIIRAMTVSVREDLPRRAVDDQRPA